MVGPTAAYLVFEEDKRRLAQDTPAILVAIDTKTTAYSIFTWVIRTHIKNMTKMASGNKKLTACG
jgi:hypothetical protein